jgi:hypothetical protein
LGISLPSSCIAIGARGQFIYKSFSFEAKFTRVLNRFRQLLKLAGLACFAIHRCTHYVFTRSTRLAHGGGQRVLFLVLAIQAIDTRRGFGGKLCSSRTKFTIVFDGFSQFLELAFFAILAYGGGAGRI